MTSQHVVEPIQRSRLYQQVVVSLCQAIRQRQIKPGQRLPPERELAEQLQVGRSSLREALRALEISGIVESRQGGGTYVREFYDGDVISPLALVLQTGDDIVGDLWEMRIMVEPALAARAAMRASPAEVAALHALLDRQEALLAVSDGIDPFEVSDREFHMTIANAAGNKVASRVVQLMKQMLRESQRYFASAYDRRQQALAYHREIVAAIDARDPPAARDAMLRHLQSIEAELLGELVADTVRHLPG
jgi:GntR family transcriptional repressor for pyruvate dehydrogenase complex